MSIGIYKITNKINNKSYIGQSVNIESRWKEHIKCGLNENHTYNNYPLYRSFRKYGLDNFNFEIIEECRIDELNIKEKYYIKYYNTYEDGYNQTLGGQTSSGVKLNAKSIQELIKDLQTDATYADLSIKYNVNEYTLSRINNGHSWHQDNIKYPISNRMNNNKINKTKVNHNIKYCIDCQQKISNTAIRCEKCYNKHRQKINRPSRDELIKMMATSSFSYVGKIYGVSDNSIKKWCIAYNLPSHKKDIISLYNQTNDIIKISKKHIRKVGQYDLDNNLIKEYKNISEAARQIGHSDSHICEACKKENGKAYGYIWKYLE